MQRLWLILGVLLNSAVALSSEGIVWSGFVNLGAATTDYSKTLYDGVLDQTTNVNNFNNLGLNLSAELSDELDLASQILGSGGRRTFDLRADWVFVTYRPMENLSLRMGRQKAPVWLVSDYIDVGYAYPWAIPPREVYSLNQLKSFSGAALEYNYDIDAVSLGLQIYGGKAAVEIVDGDNNPLDLDAVNLLGYAVHVGTSEISLRYSSAGTELTIPKFGISERPVQFSSIGLAVDWNNFMFMAEQAKLQETYKKDEREAGVQYYQQALADEAQGENRADVLRALTVNQAIQAQETFGHQGMYATLGYRLDAYLPYLTYATIKTPDNQMLIAGDQSSMTLGCKVEVAEGSAVKFEVQQLQIKEGQRGFFNANADGSIPTDLDGAKIYNLTFNTVF